MSPTLPLAYPIIEPDPLPEHLVPLEGRNPKESIFCQALGARDQPAVSGSPCEQGGHAGMPQLVSVRCTEAEGLP